MHDVLLAWRRHSSEGENNIKVSWKGMTLRRRRDHVFHFRRSDSFGFHHRAQCGEDRGAHAGPVGELDRTFIA